MMDQNFGDRPTSENLDDDDELDAAFRPPRAVALPAAASPAVNDLFQSLGDVDAKPLEWVWDGLIARGKLTLVVGEAGVGKSLFALQAAALVTQGRQTPVMQREPDDETPTIEEADNCVDPGAVLLISTDDELADTVRPRLEAAGADVNRVFLLPKNVGPQKFPSFHRNRSGPEESVADRNLERLESSLYLFRKHGRDVRLVVIDPVDSFLPCAERGKDLSAIVAKLVELAASSQVAVLMVANSASAGIGRTGGRTTTSGMEELANAARSVVMIAHDLELEHQRLMLPVKLNLCETRPGMRFSIRDHVVTWSSKPVPLTGQEYFTQARQKATHPMVREEVSELRRVMNWLEQQLSNGPVASICIRADAAENEIAYTTLRRAFRQLGCLTTKAQPGGRWIWRLPGKEVRMVYSFQAGPLGAQPDAQAVSCASTFEP